MKYIALLLCVLVVSGCFTKKPEVKDPCQDVYACSGNAGQFANDIDACRLLMECRDWRMTVR